MKLMRVFLALGVLVGLTSVAYVSQLNEGSGSRMVNAADKFLGGLNAMQKTKAVFAFDSEERLNWHFVPLQDAMKRPTRKGLPLEEMTPEQREAALALVRAGTSAHGYTEATTIMSLESILAELEKGGTNVRRPDWYFFTLFGSPSKTGKWGWRVEGHHLSLNFVVDGGKVVAATPTFFGANPATVQSGPRKGLRTLAAAEDLAKELFKALDESQRKVALQPQRFPEIQGKTPKPTVGEPKGLPAAQMNDKQRGLLRQLLDSYATRLPEDVSAAQLSAVQQQGIERIHFAYTGGTEPGQPHTYRVQGPAFVVEFLNEQSDSAKNPANHIHSAWRNLQGDFGLAK